MLLIGFPAAAFATNCFILAPARGEECLVVDPGIGVEETVREICQEYSLRPAAVLLTHGHLDHVASATRAADEWDVPVWIHAADRELLTDPAAGLGPASAPLVDAVLGRQPLTEPSDLRFFETGLDLAGLTFEVLHAPGHRPGCVMLQTPLSGHDQLDSVVFSGDVLFAGSIGRTDLPGGDHAVMLETLRGPVLGLADSAAVLPGHGQQTRMARERATNPFLQADYLGGASSR